MVPSGIKITMEELSSIDSHDFIDSGFTGSKPTILESFLTYTCDLHDVYRSFLLLFSFIAGLNVCF